MSCSVAAKVEKPQVSHGGTWKPGVHVPLTICIHFRAMYHTCKYLCGVNIYAV
jgi:hypothetical protein